MSTNTACLEEVRGQILVEKKDQGVKNGNICHLPCLQSPHLLWADLFSLCALDPSSVKWGCLDFAPVVKVKGYVSEREGFEVCWYLILWYMGVWMQSAPLYTLGSIRPSKTCSHPQRACHLMEYPERHIIRPKGTRGQESGGAESFKINRTVFLKEVMLRISLKGWKRSK